MVDGVFFITRDIGRISIERVGTPLMHIACHVVETQLVGRQQSDLMKRVMRIGIIPSHIVQAVATGIESVSAEPAASGSILPLGLGGQTESLARILVESQDKVLTVVPTDIGHRQAVAFEFRGVLTHDGFPLVLRELMALA